MLDGIRVLDLTRLLPGPFCTQLLADLGAEVIKVEAPGEGDYARAHRTSINGYGSTFLMLNRNKKSITLNLKAKPGIQIFRRLAGNADLVVEGFRPGVVDRLGISYKALKRDNPKLLYCSLSGYGQDGPYAGLAGHDINYMSYAGLTSLTGERDGKPMPLGIQAADVAAGGIMAAFGIMAAVFHRERTGRGQYIDVSMLDGLLSVGQTLFGEYMATGKVPGPATMRLNGGYPVYGIYETKDGKFFSLGALEEKFWIVFCEKAGREDLKKFHDSGWDKDRDRLEDELKKLFKTRSRDEWTELVAGEDACGSPVLGIDEALENEQARHRGMFIEVPHPEKGKVTQVAFPIKFSDAKTETPKAAPRLGQHTQEILRSVGYTKQEIEEFGEQGVV